MGFILLPRKCRRFLRNLVKRKTSPPHTKKYMNQKNYSCTVMSFWLSFSAERWRCDFISSFFTHLPLIPSVTIPKKKSFSFCVGNGVFTSFWNVKLFYHVLENYRYCIKKEWTEMSFICIILIYIFSWENCGSLVSFTICLSEGIGSFA